jgi:hypothetical protein
MQCNIDAKGKAVRLIGGMLAAALGCFGLMAWRFELISGAWAPIASLALVLIGAFMIYEGRSGWCVVRAMGFRTKL